MFVCLFQGEEPEKKKQQSNPIVYLDISIDGIEIGRIQIMLRKDIVPITAGNYCYHIVFIKIMDVLKFKIISY